MKCNCPYCNLKCRIVDEYSVEGSTCEFCFENHTEVDDQTKEITFLERVGK